MVTAKDAHALTTYFISQYTERLGSQPLVNRNKARWGFEAILMDYSAVDARSLIDFYLEHYTSPTVDFFLYNYDRVAAEKKEREDQHQRAVRLRAETEQRLTEWRNRWQKS